MDDRYTIDTPENIEFAYDIAGIGSRFLAAIIDTFILTIAEIIIGFALFALADALGLTDSQLVETYVLVLAFGGIFLFAILFYVIFEMVWNGQTPGKRVIGLRVVREGGRPITFMNSVIRNFIRLVDFLPAFYGIGVVVMFVDRRARRLGDLAGGTLVVKERRGVTLESLTSGSLTALPPLQPGETAPQPTLPNVHLLNDKDYDLVQEFLRRRNELGRDARQRLGAQLASGFQARLGLPQGGDAERFLQHVASEYQLLKRQQQIES